MIHHAQNKQEILDNLEKVNDKIVLLNFHSEQCGPCIMQMPILEDLSNDLDIVLLTFDIDLSNKILSHFNVSATPTTQIYKNNELKFTKVGFFSYQDWKEEILKYQ